MLIIADRIDSGRKHVAHAIASRNKRFLRSESQAQAQAGADYMGLKLSPTITSSGPAVAWLIDNAQQAGDLPLCLSGIDPQTILGVLPDLEAPPLVDLSGLAEEEAVEMMGLLAERRARVALPLGGDPPFGDGKSGLGRTAGRLLSSAAGSGLAREDIFGRLALEPLALSPQSGREAIRFIAEMAGSGSGPGLICRPSDLSRGGRDRALIEQAFVAAAVAAGLQGVFMDPTEVRLMGLLRASLMINGDGPAVDEFEFNGELQSEALRII